MLDFHAAYVFTFGTACLVASIFIIKHRASLELSTPQYRRFLFQRWKVTTFLISSVGLVVIAPHTGDPTWDYVNATFMSVLTFCTAPWVVGILYFYGKGKAPFYKFYIAVCLWMFTASWSYDLYILCRDGYYPQTWLPNIFASSVLYFSAGLLWSLEWVPNRGVVFGFMISDWPEIYSTQSFSKIFWYGMPFIILVIVAILPFVI